MRTIRNIIALIFLILYFTSSFGNCPNECSSARAQPISKVQIAQNGYGLHTIDYMYILLKICSIFLKKDFPIWCSSNCNRHRALIEELAIDLLVTTIMVETLTIAVILDEL